MGVWGFHRPKIGTSTRSERVFGPENVEILSKSRDFAQKSGFDGLWVNGFSGFLKMGPPHPSCDFQQVQVCTKKNPFFPSQSGYGLPSFKQDSFEGGCSGANNDIFREISSRKKPLFLQKNFS